MEASLEFDPYSVELIGGHLIAGELSSDGERTIQVTRPSDRMIAGEIPVAGEDIVDRAVRAASAALKTSGWAASPPRERARVLRRWADLVEANRDLLCQVESVVSTRIIREVHARDVKVCADVLRYFAEWADKVDGKVSPTADGSLGLIMREPYGVVGAIVPWNFPLILSSWKFAPALAAGNAVVLKPSEMTPYSIVMLARLAVEAGLPAGLFNIVQGDGKTGSALVRHPGVALVTFTGSSQTGTRILQDAAPSMKPVTLELGGKGPQLVFADTANSIERIADLVTRGFSVNAGQACFAGSRLVVQRGIKDRLLELVAKRASRLRPGPTWKPDTTLAPVVNGRQLDRMAAIVSRASEGGASPIIGGKALEAAAGGWFFEPTILDNVTAESPAFEEEIFGPVLSVQTFEDEQEGFALADHPSFGLTASVYTHDLDRAMRAIRNIQSGTVWVNNFGRSDDMSLPFGGYKRSGLGRELGRVGYESYQRTKSVWIQFPAASAA